MHAGSALGYPPPKTAVSVRFVAVTDPLNDMFQSVLS